MTKPPPSPIDPRAERLAAALRANLRRRKAAAASSAPGQDDAPRSADGAPDGEGLYAHPRRPDRRD